MFTIGNLVLVLIFLSIAIIAYYGEKAHKKREQKKIYRRLRVKNRAFINLENMPLVRKSEKINRNVMCPCGSGLKYKKCCLNK